MHVSGQIIATSHDLTPNGGLVRDHPLISGKPRLVKYNNLARCIPLNWLFNHGILMSWFMKDSFPYLGSISSPYKP